jgi:succinate---hydroxymethylglutarate CoA-transferase
MPRLYRLPRCLITTSTTCTPKPLYNRISPLSPSHIRHKSTTTSPRAALDTTRLPLHGLRILDLSRVLAGPFCTQILADYGADVTKIEQPGQGDETRQWRASGETAQKWKASHPLMSLYFASVNRNKRSVTLNLKSEAGRQIVRELAKRSDVLVHNFLPGKMEKMGLGWEELRKVNKRLVYAAVSGYGATGPSRDRAGYDAIALAEAGMLHITGEKGGRPTKPGVAIADLCTGLYAHGAILAALRQRDVTGLGTKIEGSLFETSLSLLINVGLASLNLDLDKGREGRRRGGKFGLGHAALVPYGGFDTKDGRMIFIAANNNRQWKKLCDVMSVGQLEQEQKFASNDGRVENRDELNSRLQSRFNELNRSEWLDLFDGTGLPYGPIVSSVSMFQTSKR